MRTLIVMRLKKLTLRLLGVFDESVLINRSRRAEVQLLELAHELVMLSTADDVIKVEGNTIDLNYVGVALKASRFVLMVITRTRCVLSMHENTARLEKIKSDLVSWAA